MIGVSSERKGEDPKNLKRKPANVVMKYMQDFGYKVIPVNPFAAGETINGEVVVKDLEDINIPIDIVDVFRPSNEAPGIAKKTAKIGSKVLWLQYGLHSDEAEKISENSTDKKINWNTTDTINFETVRLKFILEKSSLYSFWTN